VSSKTLRQIKSRSLNNRPPKGWATLAGVTVLALAAGGGGRMPDGRPTPTGLEVPRWVSLKSAPVRARAGPGLDHRILWEYHAAGLPVQVIAETREWRKVCDPEGSVAWIHRTVASGRRTAFNASTAEVSLYSRPDASSAVRARLRARATVGLDDCENGWCRVRAGKLRGWAQQSALFGTQGRALCPADRPAGPAPTR
jgi:SH3-like domain-containing protein